MIYIGIDPGVNGGIGIWDNSSFTASPCPGTIRDMAERIPMGAVAVIEAVHSFPGQGVASTFKFGKNFGQWLGILAALGIPYKEVTPSKWMKYFGAMPKDKTARKNHLKHLAQQRFPGLKITLKTADAILLAVYAREVAWI